MTATDELRKLLDEFEHECFMLRVEASETRAKDEAVRMAYERIREESAQAIAATLGSGTCEWELEHSGTLYDKWRCSVCGYGLGDHRWAYCPKCGRKVKR